MKLHDCSCEQHRRFARALALIDEAIAARAFPAAALAVTVGDDLLVRYAAGRQTYEIDAPSIATDTPFDLASLTKPLATTAMAMLLTQRGQLELDAPVANYLPEFASANFVSTKNDAADACSRTADCADDEMTQRAWRAQVTPAMLLAHSSGLPAHRKYYLEVSTREALLARALCEPLEAAPLTRVRYSDIGFIVLGELLERIAGEPLDRFCQREIYEPLALGLRFAAAQRIVDAPPTLIDRSLRHCVIQGEVNDDNASVLQGVAGHAGLFGSALDVATFAAVLLNGGQSVFAPETIARFTRRQSQPTGTARTLGWDTPTAPSQSGTHFSLAAFGHLGYTGTSLWCEPERRLSITLLTNRSYPDDGSQLIRQYRPRIYDAIFEALD